MKFQFEHGDYTIDATVDEPCTEGFYVGEVDFIVYDEQGDDITCDISGLETINIHQRVVEEARSRFDLERGLNIYERLR